MTTDTTTAHLLKTFHPAPPNADNGVWEHALTGVGTDAVLVSPHFDLDHLDERAGSPLIHTLYHALKINEMLPQHFNADPSIEGEPWYDALPMIDALNVTLFVDGAEIGYDEAEDLFESDEAKAIRPERIVMRLGMSAHGMPQPPVVIETDVVLFPNPDSRYDPYGIHAVVSAGSTIEPKALAELFCGAFFVFDDEVIASYERQRNAYMESTFELAAHVLKDAAGAAHVLIERRAHAHLRHLVPVGMEVAIRLNRDDILDVVVQHGAGTP